jgi:hypothetical protein
MHETESVLLDGERIDIDAKLVPLLRLLWSCGLSTLSSCQEYHPQTAYIEFANTADAASFLNVAGRDYFVVLDRWDEGIGEAHEFRIRLLCFFPIGDIPMLAKRFAAEVEE